MTDPDAPAPGGCLFVVATPIGNLADFTDRARATLADVDAILCEDTRTSATLLAHHGIATRVEPLHAHNESRRADEVVAALVAGRRVALISDAGTPAVSDPGARLVARARAAGVRIVPIPGANAAVTAMSVAGIEGPFTFLGFLPPKSGARRAVLAARVASTDALVLHEAPHRVRETIDDLVAVFGGARHVLFARELTKRFESIDRMPLAEAPAWLAADPNRLRGEFVLVIDGADPAAADDLAEAERVLRLLVEESLPLRQAVGLAAKITGARRNAVYARALALRDAGELPGSGPEAASPGDD